MIASVRGTLLDKGFDHILVEVGGVGLRVHVSLQTLAQLPPVGQPVTLLTHLQVREDALTLFGFGTPEERTSFELCVGVQQVGPKLAMSILSTLEPAALAEAVLRGDHGRLQRIPGVGRKTAERLSLELKDKFQKMSLGARTSSGMSPPGPASSTVVSALVNLGYKQAAAERAAEEAARSEPGAPVEEVMRRALRALAE